MRGAASVACRASMQTAVTNIVTGATGAFSAMLAATPLGEAIEVRNAARQAAATAEAAIASAADEVSACPGPQ